MLSRVSRRQYILSKRHVEMEVSFTLNPASLLDWCPGKANMPNTASVENTRIEHGRKHKYCIQAQVRRFMGMEWKVCNACIQSTVC